MPTPGRSPRPRGFRALVPAQAWATLAQQGVRAHHQAREYLLHQGAPGGWVYLCLSGRVKVVYAEPDGRELMLAVRGPGDVIGELATADSGFRSTSVQTIEPGITSKLPDQRFDEFVERLGLGQQLNSYILGKLRESATHAWQLAHRTTPARLAALLLSVIKAAGPDHPRATTIAMSQEELAAALGLARSAITPVLAEWKAAGWIRIARGSVEVTNLTKIAYVAVSSSGQTVSESQATLVPP
ncbi:Crp/Fnr family transcriptional regulator [Amycolatopsis sp. NPDC048633]|uniref:Crp/Fnr family transcriptional regulator n=1 Tax=Amycolatopsis sp. NPDC048633 TaxID=3157095 RepID=UPI0033DE56B7